MKPPEDKSALLALEIAAKAFCVSLEQVFKSKRCASSKAVLRTAWLMLRTNGWNQPLIGRVFTTHQTTVGVGVAHLRRLMGESPIVKRVVERCIEEFGSVPPPPKPALAHMCECGKPGKVRFGGYWVCVRCSLMDREPRDENKQHNPNAKYNRVYSYTLPQGSALN
jgi:hypothetical protein